MERNQGQKFLNAKKASWNFNLSDIKNDITQYLDRTDQLKSVQNSPFDPKKISARSTHIQSKPKFKQMDSDEIMKSSSSEAVRNEYRDILAVKYISNLPETTDSRSSISRNDNVGTTYTACKERDFWDETNPSIWSLTENDTSGLNDEDVTSAEHMALQLEQDEKIKEMESAANPRVNKVQEETLNWENNLSRQPKMSFGQYCQDEIKQSNIREVYSNASPPRRQDRIPLVDFNDTGYITNSLKKDGKYDMNNIEDLIKKCDPNKLSNIFFDPQMVKRRLKEKQELNVDRIIELSEKARNLMRMKEPIDMLDDIPVQDENIKDDDLQRGRNELQPQYRGVKRRSSSLSNETQRSELDKCLRSRSPSNHRELEAAAAKFKPKMVNDEYLIKRPLPSDSTISKNCPKSPSRFMNWIQGLPLIILTPNCGLKRTVSRKFSIF